MAWIESHQGLARHIKTKRLARKLNTSVPAVIGHLHLLWWWAMDNLPDGCLSMLEPEDIAEEMMWRGDASELIASLIEVGFVDEMDGQLYIHDWHDYIGRLADKRKTDAARKREKRKTSDGNLTDSPRTIQRTSNGQDADSPRTIQRTSDGQDMDNPVDVRRMSSVTVPNLTVPINKDDDVLTRTDEQFSKVLGAFCELHGKLDTQVKALDITAMNEMIALGVPTSLIIGVMTRIHEERGGQINSFSYYKNAIHKAWQAEKAINAPLPYGTSPHGPSLPSPRTRNKQQREIDDLRRRAEEERRREQSRNPRPDG